MAKNIKYGDAYFEFYSAISQSLVKHLAELTVYKLNLLNEQEVNGEKVGIPYDLNFQQKKEVSNDLF